MKRYKVEFISNDKKNKFSVNCSDKNLEYWKDVCKDSSKDGVCFYRKYPLTKSEKIYF